jgi:hypothetical protein
MVFDLHFKAGESGEGLVRLDLADVGEGGPSDGGESARVCLKLADPNGCGTCLAGIGRAETGEGVGGIVGILVVGGGMAAGTGTDVLVDRIRIEGVRGVSDDISDDRGSVTSGGLGSDDGSGLGTRITRGLDVGADLIFGVSTSCSSKRKRKSRPNSWRSFLL